jgi:hypothetical protein
MMMKGLWVEKSSGCSSGCSSSSRASASAFWMPSGVSSLSRLARLLQFVEQVGGRFDADVAGQQQGFQFFEQFVVDLAAREDRFELAAPTGRACAPARP